MAARLTDKQKKKIIADYIQIGSYNAVAKLNKVSKDTVKRIVQNCDDFAQKAQQKKSKTPPTLSPIWKARGTMCARFSKFASPR